MLEDMIVPVCKYRIEKNNAIIERSIGTAFFINSQGVFLTAGHVVKAIPNQTTGLCIKHKTTLKNIMSPIVNIEYASDNVDVAIGKIEYETHHWFELEEFNPTYWLNVATLGYPETAFNVNPADYYINLRAHKGYIQRIIAPNELSYLGPHKTLLELNFAIPCGLSGAPLFKVNGSKNILLGVCIGSHTSEIVDYEYNSHIDDQSTHSERKVKVEQYGIAQDISEILEWKPDLLKDKTLRNIFENPS